MFVLIIYLYFITEHLFSWKHKFVLTPFHSACQTLLLTCVFLLVFHYSLEKVVTEWHAGAINLVLRWSHCQQVICTICYKVSWASDHLNNNHWWNSNIKTTQIYCYLKIFNILTGKQPQAYKHFPTVQAFNLIKCINQVKSCL